ncbi:MAG: hypothetical protein ACR2H4_06485 [Pyrinomonadaceae bacterium]
MSWEQRNNRSYYYRKKREDSRVLSVYVGRGEIALLAAQLDEVRREQKEAVQVKMRIEMQALEALDQSIDNLVRLSSTLTEAILIAGGFHQHKRQWRKQKHERNCGSG